MLYLWLVFTFPTFVPISLPLFVLPVALLLNSCHHKKNCHCMSCFCVRMSVCINTNGYREHKYVRKNSLPLSPPSQNNDSFLAMENSSQEK